MTIDIDTLQVVVLGLIEAYTICIRVAFMVKTETSTKPLCMH